MARALYGNPSIVVLDEPNANLDSEGEDALRRTLDVLKKPNVTVLIVAHRQTVLAGADKLLILQRGVVNFFGTPMAFAASKRAVGKTLAAVP